MFLASAVGSGSGCCVPSRLTVCNDILRRRSVLRACLRPMQTLHFISGLLYSVGLHAWSKLYRSIIEVIRSAQERSWICKL